MPDILCSRCREHVVKVTKYQNWLKLANFLDFMLSEEYIEIKTYESLMNSLIDLKEFAFEDNCDEPDE
jgi:hypothetical protein